MAISPSLRQFVSSGTYRLTFDKSQTIGVPSQTTRLVIGFSKKGVFNSPVYCADTEFFVSVFGDIDSSLERKGSFFHRTALTCLANGPIIALNLLSLDDELDKSQFKSISTSASDKNSNAALAPVSKYYNRDKFWYPDAAELKQVAEIEQSESSNRLINVANIGRRPVSVIIRKSDALGFDVMAKEWYTAGQVPVFLNENDYISDYMVDIIVVDGSFSDYESIMLDPVFGPYFDSKGLKKNYTDSVGNTRDGLTAFLNLSQVNVLGIYTGSLIPQMQDKLGNDIFVQNLVNAETFKTGVLLSINEDLFDEGQVTLAGNSRYLSGDIIDLVGHTLESEQPAEIEFLSYKGVILKNLSFESGSTANSTLSVTVGAKTGLNAQVQLSASSELQGATGYVAASHFDTLTIFGPSSIPATGFTTLSALEFNSLLETIKVGESYLPVNVIGATSNVNYGEVQAVNYSFSSDILTVKLKLTISATTDIDGPKSLSEGFFVIKATGVTTGGGTAGIKLIKSLDYAAVESNNEMWIGPGSDLYTKIVEGVVSSGDKISTGLTGATKEDFILTKVNGNLVLEEALVSYLGATANLSNKVDQYKLVIAADVAENIYVNGNEIFVQVSGGTINESFEIVTAESDPTNTVWIDNTGNSMMGKIVKGDYLVTNFGGTAQNMISPITGKSRLTKIVSVSTDTTKITGQELLKIVTGEPIYIKDNIIEKYKDIRNFAENYSIMSLTGYSLRADQMPNGTADRQNQILSILYNTNLAQALSDKDIISFRYIVDSFEGVIESESKSRLSLLAKRRENAFAILNMPSVKQFKESTDPMFKFNTDSAFDTRFIGLGGNLDMNPVKSFSLPSIDNGANFGAWYGPNLIVRERGTNLSVPPAAHVSNLYIEKTRLGNPYDIVAGPRRGVVSGASLVGVEYNFDRQDLDNIEPFGYNAIVNKRGFGLTINANQTGQQSIQSALSQAHVRELVIYIQDGIEAILKNYRWEFNTAQVRLEIKTLADNFLGQILNDGGLYFFENVMDTSNNTPEIIDSNIGILDTYIEPVKGLGILVHRTTILKTGARSSQA